MLWVVTHDDTQLFTIGEVARRSGLSVKAIRFYTDEGLLAATRSDAGYRMYDLDAVARAELVRTLRDTGIGLAAVREVLDRQRSLREVALAHAAALDAQIRELTLRRAVVRAVTKRRSTTRELKAMNRLARMSDPERQQLIDEFWDEVFDGLDMDPEFATRMRSARPQLPDDPSPEQLDAWVELAEMVTDPAFRASIRTMCERHSLSRTEDEQHVLDGPGAQQVGELSCELAQAALDAGKAPDSDAGREAADAVVAKLAELGDDTTGEPGYRADLADRFEAFSDERAERYWRLLATVNGWPPIPSSMHLWRWTIDALRAHA